jgi:hypothetical protein
MALISTPQQNTQSWFRSDDQPDDVVSISTVFRIPDLLPRTLLEGTSFSWPCNSPPNPLKEITKVQCHEWVKSLNVMSEEDFSNFTKYGIMNVAVLAYRRADPMHFRIIVDFMHSLWIIDDRTDQQSSTEVELEMAKVKRVLADPDPVYPEQGVLERVCQS